mmetsp:Transcript_33819/g.60415  ORF Transcript_33819/g.60415 Transcript_33819/m.60415 type:complete len:240 (-) Transcript_33819:1788-2507(-)
MVFFLRLEEERGLDVTGSWGAPSVGYRAAMGDAGDANLGREYGVLLKVRKQTDVGEPEANENSTGAVVCHFVCATKLRAQKETPCHQTSQANGGADAEDDDALHKADGGGGEGDAALDLPVDGGDGPGEPDSEEDVDRVGAGDVTQRCIRGLLLLSRNLGSKGVRERRPEGHKCDGGERLAHSGGAAKQAGDLAHHSGQRADEDQADHEGEPAAVQVGRGDEREQNLPKDGEKVHDAVQ